MTQTEKEAFLAKREQENSKPFALFALFFLCFFKLTDLIKHSIQLAQKLA